MQGASYFQAKSGLKRKPTSLIDTLDYNACLAKGTQPDALKAISLKHADRVANLHRNVSHRYASWRFKLRLGFSLLFYGYGSKKAILDGFGREVCQDGGVLAVNGWGHMLSLRSLLLKAASMLRSPGLLNTRTTGDARAVVAAIREGIGDQTLYLIIHSIDAPALRSAEAHSILGELAAIPGIHFVASIDHVNAPLLWDKRTAANFKWVFQELTTFLPYTHEAQGTQTLLCSAMERVERQGVFIVLQTLVPNARNIFRILAEAQLDESSSGGMTFHELFRLCRESFLVSNEVALRSHLNEFRDHQLLQNRKSSEGAELLHIPMADSTLEEILVNLE